MAKVKAIFSNIDTWIKISIFVSLCLIIASFILPPQGVIDPSVLAGVGEITGMVAILSIIIKLPEYINAGHSAKISYGSMNIELNKKENDKENDSADTEILE